MMKPKIASRARADERELIKVNNINNEHYVNEFKVNSRILLNLFFVLNKTHVVLVIPLLTLNR